MIILLTSAYNLLDLVVELNPQYLIVSLLDLGVATLLIRSTTKKVT